MGVIFVVAENVVTKKAIPNQKMLVHNNNYAAGFYTHW